MEQPADFLLVIPAYREHLRLPPFLRELAGALAAAPFSTAIRVVDDGSPEREGEALRREIAAIRDSRSEAAGACRLLEPLRLPWRQGKGAAILKGWREPGLDPSARWLAFVDADGAVPASETVRFLSLAFHSVPEEAGLPLFAVRSGGVRRKWRRRWASRAFAGLIRLFFGPLSPAGDTQCGFKIVPAALFATLEPPLQEAGFCFDLELYLALRRAGKPPREAPVAWREKEGRFSLGGSSPEILRDLIRLRRRMAR